MGTINPFTPAGSANLSVTATSANVLLPVGAGESFYIVNTTAGVWIKTGATSTAAATASTTGSWYMPANTAKVFNLDQSATYIAAVAATGATSVLYITRGDGQ